MILGRVTGREITTIRDSDGPVLLLQVELTNERDIQDVELLRHAGVDYNPPDGSFVVVLPLANAFQVGVAVDDGIEPEVDEGEYEVYSSVGGAKRARTRWNKDGEVIHNQGSRLVARKNDETISNATLDPAFWTWIAAVGSALGITPPTTFTGKVNDGASTVKVP